MIFYLLMFLVGIEALLIRQNENDIYCDLINSTMNSCLKEVHADVGVLKDLKSFPELKFPVHPDTGYVLYCMFKRLKRLGDDLALEKQAHSASQIGDEPLDAALKHYNSCYGKYRFYKDRRLLALKPSKCVRKLMNDIKRCYNENPRQHKEPDTANMESNIGNQGKREYFLREDTRKGNNKLIHNQILYAKKETGCPEVLSENEKNKICYPQDEKEVVNDTPDDEKGVNDALEDKEETELPDKKETGYQHSEKECNRPNNGDDYEITMQDYKDDNELRYEDKDDCEQSDQDDVDLNYVDPITSSETTAQTTRTNDNRKSVDYLTAYKYTLNGITTETLKVSRNQGLQSQKSSSAIRPTTIAVTDTDWHKSKTNKSVNSEQQPSWLYHSFVKSTSLHLSKQDKFDVNKKIIEFLLNFSKDLNKTSAAELQSIMNKFQTNLFRNVSVI